MNRLKKGPLFTILCNSDIYNDRTTTTESDSCNRQKMARLFTHRGIGQTCIDRVYPLVCEYEERQRCSAFKGKRNSGAGNFKFDQRKQNSTIDGKNINSCRDYSKTNQKLNLIIDNTNQWLVFASCNQEALS